MKQIISAKTAGNILLFLFLLLVVFHILLMTGFLPSDIAWGGQMNGTTSQRILMEISALAVLLLFAWIIAARVGYNKMIKSRKVINIGVWMVFFYMALNTAGNLLSPGSIETRVFAPLTILMALLTLRLAIKK